MDIPADTFETVTTVFVELFCTPKSSMENPSLRVSGHFHSMNRTFIVEDYAEDEFGQWAKDEVTGEQGYVDDERSCFWTWDDTECAWQSRPFKDRQVKRRKGKGQGKGKGRSKRTGRAFFGDEQPKRTNNSTITRTRTYNRVVHFTRSSVHWAQGQQWITDCAHGFHSM